MCTKYENKTSLNGNFKKLSYQQVSFPEMAEVYSLKRGPVPKVLEEQGPAAAVTL